MNEKVPADRINAAVWALASADLEPGYTTDDVRRALAKAYAVYANVMLSLAAEPATVTGNLPNGEVVTLFTLSSRDGEFVVQTED